VKVEICKNDGIDDNVGTVNTYPFCLVEMLLGLPPIESDQTWGLREITGSVAESFLLAVYCIFM
jgi:hypothetical protein